MERARSLDQNKSRAATISVISNTALVIFKLVIGIVIGSVSVISEAIHSGVDLVAALIALFAVKESAKPADGDHPYGHGKFENISGTIEALLIFLAAGWIIYEAVVKLGHPGPMESIGLGVVIMAVSAVTNILVSKLLFRVAKESDSVALEADAWHLRTDVYTSAGVAVALLLIWIGGALFPGYNLAWVDPAAAILVALLIIKAAWELTVKSTLDLLDVALPKEEEEWIRQRLRSLSSSIRGVHRLRTRKSGPQRFIDLHLMLDANLTLLQAHDFSDQVVAAVHERFPNASVLVHQEPCTGENCKEHCKPGCLRDRA